MADLLQAKAVGVPNMSLNNPTLYLSGKQGLGIPTYQLSYLASCFKKAPCYPVFYYNGLLNCGGERLCQNTQYT